MTVNDNTAKSESLGGFFKNPGKNGLSVSEKMAKKRIKQPWTSIRFNSKNSYISCF